MRLQPLLQLANSAQWPLSVNNGEMPRHFHYDFSLPQDSLSWFLKQVLLNVNKIAGLLKPALPITMEQASISVPQVDFSLQDAPELQFQDLQLKLQNISLKQAAEPLLTIPQIAINNVRLI